MIGWNEHHVRRLTAEYVQFYNDDRPHRALGLEPPNGPKPIGSGPLIVDPVLGHHVYRRVA